MSRVHCPQTECEANKKGICSLTEIFFSSDSRYPFICNQKFTPYDRLEGYIPSWEVPVIEETKKE